MNCLELRLWQPNPRSKTNHNAATTCSSTHFFYNQLTDGCEKYCGGGLGFQLIPLWSLLKVEIKKIKRQMVRDAVPQRKAASASQLPFILLLIDQKSEVFCKQFVLLLRCNYGICNNRNKPIQQNYKTYNVNHLVLAL